jgi:hypothetical protein
MKTLNQSESKVEHAAFLDALSSEFLNRTGCGAYVYLNPFDIYQLFEDYLGRNMPIRDYVKISVKSYFQA